MTEVYGGSAGVPGMGDGSTAEGASIAYGSPETVLADDSLSAEQKMRFLEEWRATLRQHLAGDEVIETDVPDEADLVGRIDRALATIRG